MFSLVNKAEFSELFKI